jgi:uncharacterized protein
MSSQESYTNTDQSFVVEGRPHLSGLFDFFKRHPITSAIAIFLVDLVTAFIAGIFAKAVFPEAQPDFIATIIMAVVIGILLTLLGWWRHAGFTGPSSWRNLGILWLPALVVLVLPAVRGFQRVDSSTLIYLAIGYILTGFMEESWMRGLVLRVLGPTGPVRAVVISSILFGLLHVGNLLYRNPLIVFAQMIGAAADGIGMGAIRLRTNTIWFVIAIHTFHDLFLKLSNLPTIPLDVVQDVILFGFGVYLLRKIVKEQAGQPPVPNLG